MKKIKSMSVDEMADFIEKNYKCERCVYNHNCYRDDCKSGIREWLKIGRELKDECKHLDFNGICRNDDCPAMGGSCPCNEYPEICKFYEPKFCTDKQNNLVHCEDCHVGDCEV